MESQATVAAFRRDFRLVVLQRLVLANLFSSPVMSGRLTADDSLGASKLQLQLSSRSADQALGQLYSGDPARVALYADEAKSITDEMADTLDEIHGIWRQSFPHD